MKRHLASSMAATIAAGWFTLVPQAQSTREPRAITARLHGTFLDTAGGLGVLSGDLTVVAFDVRFGVLSATGKIEGALADSKGDVLGHVDQDVVMAVSNITSSCNQLRMEVGPADADVLRTQVHFDKEVAGYDSRQDGFPKQDESLCGVARALTNTASSDVLASELNKVVASIASK